MATKMFFNVWSDVQIRNKSKNNYNSYSDLIRLKLQWVILLGIGMSKKQ